MTAALAPTAWPTGRASGEPGQPQANRLNRRLVVLVLARQGLWDQGVRFGITDPFKKQHFVLINPGLSGLTARQILDRMLRGG